MISKETVKKLFDLYEKHEEILQKRLGTLGQRFDLDLTITFNYSIVRCYEWFLPTETKFNVLAPEILNSIVFDVTDETVDYVVRKVNETFEQWEK